MLLHIVQLYVRTLAYAHCTGHQVVMPLFSSEQSTLRDLRFVPKAVAATMRVGEMCLAKYQGTVHTTHSLFKR